MRSLLLAALLLCAALAATPATASTLPEPLTVLQDAAGDGFAPLGLPPLALRSWDLRSLAVTDGEDDVTFRLAVDAFGDPAANAEYRGGVRVTFRHGEVTYTLYLTEFNEYRTIYSSTLYRWSEVTQSNLWVASFGYVEPSGNELVVTYSKLDLADERGAMPFQGKTLEGFTAQSYLFANGDYVNVDAMPNQGEGLAYPMRGGLEQRGVALWSLAPFRTSNGEATTFVYTVQVENLGPANGFELSATRAPPGWTVEFPVPQVEVPDRATVEVPVLATIPFAHEHGTAPSFLVQATNLGGDLGQIRLGVSYPKTPILSGHHPDVYLHTGLDGGIDADAFQVPSEWNSNGWAWMTPMEEDPSDSGEHYIGRPIQNGPTATTFFWYVSGRDQPLGLDLDLASPVTVRMPIKIDTPLAGAQFRALFYAGWPTGDGAFETVPIAEMSSEVRDLSAGESEFVLESLPMPDSDRIEVRKDMYTGWNFWLTGERPALPAALATATPLAASLLPGGSAHVPLVEFHDAVEDVYALAGGLRLASDGPEHRLVNPGETAVFTLALSGNDAGDVHVALRGAHADWAKILGPTVVGLSADEPKTLRVAVSPPASTEPQQLDLLVQAHGPHGATALLRLGGQVVTSRDVPDEAALVPGLEAGRDSPAPAMAWVGLAVLAVAAAFRRRAFP